MKNLSWAVTSFFLCCSANAVPVQWQLTDVTMLTGSFDSQDHSLSNPYSVAITGAFIYDADLAVGQRYSDVNISIEGDDTYIDGRSTVNKFDLTPSDDMGWFFAEAVTPPEVFHLPFYDAFYLQLEYDSNLTNAGGTVALVTGYAAGEPGQFYLSGPGVVDCDYLEGCGGIGDAQTGAIWGGTIIGTVVPVPAAVWLFGSALAGLSLLRKRNGAQ